jgi:hypothetical protein
MLKVLAVLRSVFLIFIIGYTMRAMPWTTSVARTFDEQYARCSNSVDLLLRAAWVAVCWIALETAVGWVMALRSGRKESPAAPPAGPGRP